LDKNPTTRLGAGPTDAQEVKSHPFFAGIKWDDFLNLRVKPPFFPKIVIVFCYFLFDFAKHAHDE
jgi:hypothetical protein